MNGGPKLPPAELTHRIAPWGVLRQSNWGKECRMPLGETGRPAGGDPSDLLPDREAHLRKVAALCARSVREFACDDPDRPADSAAARISMKRPQDHQTWWGPGK